MARVMAGLGAGTGAGIEAPERVEIITRNEGRRSFSAEDKVRVVAETFRPGETVTAVSRRHGICTSLLHRWRRAARGEVPSRRAPVPRLLPVRLVAPDEPSMVMRPTKAKPAAAGGTASLIEVVLRNGRVLRVAATADAAAVARLAAALEA